MKEVEQQLWELVAPYLAAEGVELPQRSLPSWLARPVAALVEGIWRTLRIRSQPPLVRHAVDLMCCDCTLDDSKARLAPGMSASGVLRLDSGVRGVTVPRDAIIRYPDGRVTVWIAEADGEQAKVRELRVQTGLGFGGRIAITSGLEAGALVVVRGNESLYEGQAVILREADS